jgi:PERQ amino acid-rich with GYF domain-containing protein
VRRRTDYKEPALSGNGDERDKERGAADNAGSFGTLKRATIAPFSPGGTAAPWSASAGGTFPMGAFGSFGNSQPEKKAGFGSMRGESRFKGLMGKTSIEDFDKAPKEKASLSNLGKLSEGEPGKSTTSWMEARSSRPMSNDTDPFPDDDMPSGSAALHGGDDLSPPRRQGVGAFGTPQRPETRDTNEFSAFGMTADFHGRENYAHQTPHRAGGGHEPMSPTYTNPYQSPDHARNDLDDESEGSADPNAQYPGMGSFQVDSSANPGMHNAFGGFGGLGRVPGPFEIAPSDRSQTSSVGPSRGFPTLPGLGLGGTATWGTGQQTLGTPIRERGLGAFENAFGNVGEAQSPSLAGLGFGSNSGLGHGTVGRGASRLGSLFPTSMQEQMRNEQHRPSVDDGSSHGDRQQSMTGAFGRGAFGGQAPGGTIPNRDTDSPFRANRNLFDDFSGASADEHGSAFGQATTSLSMAALNQTRTAQPSTPGISSPASNQPPAAQQRTMVMPDRMRWIYRDPTGNTQGPFSGLEMHDWYKAGFFSPELLVKKQEEPDYEPLAQLIRRIGNSREPFLVPQIGIPHGPPTAQSGNAWAGSAGPTAAPGAQPPFANSFPSFGTTLTAEQQNALERRKQEEQYLMARQKEHLAAQQQALARQVQIGGILPNQLQHQASAHSLQSQPSYGSITSPGGYQPSPTQGSAPGASVPGLIDNAFRSGPVSVPGLGPLGSSSDMMGSMRDDEVSGLMERLNIGRSGQPTFGSVPLTFGQQQPESSNHAQQVVAMLSDRARLQREQAEHDALQRFAPNEQQNAQSFADRLQQFNDLRLQTDLDQAKVGQPPAGVIGKPSAPAAQSQGETPESASPESTMPQYHNPDSKTAFGQEPLSLTEQVQKAQSAKHSPQPHSAWNKVEPAIFPFPPPPSQSPLPAPAAQRKPIIAESLATESRSGAATPAADTPSASIAPWAKEPAESSRGPSLREIQEAEAKKAAEREASAAAARREAFEKELIAQTQSPVVQPGLPSSSTWASSASPVTPIGAAASVWGAKPAAGKVITPSGSMSKKTLQQIQKEEEARKQRAVSQAAASATVLGNVAVPAPSAGKRYADLAGKTTTILPSIPGVNSAWTTVGASGKTRAPGGTTPVSAAVRSTSTTVVPSVLKKPVVTRSTTAGGQSGKVNAEEEFRKWAVNELRHDLNKGINGMC